MKKLAAVILTLALVLTCAVCAESVSLQKGDSGEDVKAIQQALIDLGYLNDVADGQFGGKTEAAVTDFQKENNLPATGVVDAQTKDMILASAESQPAIAPRLVSKDGFVIYDHDGEVNHDFVYTTTSLGLQEIVLQPGDLTEEWLCAAVAEITKQGMNTDQGEYVETVILEDRDLQITVVLPPSAFVLDEKRFFAENRAGSITDELMDYDELDKFWSTITITMKIDKPYTVKLGKEHIEVNEYGMRYMSAEEIIDQIWK